MLSQPSWVGAAWDEWLYRHPSTEELLTAFIRMNLGQDGQGLYLGDWSGPTLAEAVAADQERQVEQRKAELGKAMDARQGRG